jgi:hypothetical protein
MKKKYTKVFFKGTNYRVDNTGAIFFSRDGERIRSTLLSLEHCDFMASEHNSRRHAQFLLAYINAKDPNKKHPVEVF